MQEGDRVLVRSGGILVGEVGTVTKTFLRYGIHTMVRVDMDRCQGGGNVTFHDRNLRVITEIELPSYI